MPNRIADRLSATRQRRIVGRDAERALFQQVLSQAEPPFVVLNLYGPGGVGKSTLLQAFVDACQDAGCAYHFADGRTIDPSPHGFVGALGPEMQQRLENSDERLVLLIDNFEALEPLESWLREKFLPTLSGEVVCVIAGRNPVSALWRGDLGWRGLLRVAALRNLSPDESRFLLTGQGVPEHQHDTILAFTYGYPLALSLVSDLIAQKGQVFLDDGPPPDIIPALLERFLAAVPSPQHRAALEACALVRVTTEAVLSRLLGVSDAGPYFDWLRKLSILEEAQPGLAPQDVAREALLADLRWRNPDRYAELHRRARAYYTEQLNGADPVEQQRLLWDYIFLHRDNAIVRSAFTWQDSAAAYADQASESDHADLRALVARFEGEDMALLLDYWLARPDRCTVHVFRSSQTGNVSGLLARVALERTERADHRADPAIGAAAACLAAEPPLRPGETASYFRFWMASDSYHGVSPVQSAIIVNIVRHYLTTPGLAYSYLPIISPEHWHRILAYTEMRPLPAAGFASAMTPFHVYYYDWRQLPPMAWLAVMAEKEIRQGGASAPESRPTPIVVLSKEAFLEAVREALKHFHQPERLGDSPLLRSRMLLERAGSPSSASSARTNLLRSLVREAVRELDDVPRRQRAYRALDRTYVNPAPTQEKAAELLDLPFSTYRRHLNEGIAAVAEQLWQRELEAGLK